MNRIILLFVVLSFYACKTDKKATPNNEIVPTKNTETVKELNLEDQIAIIKANFTEVEQQLSTLKKRENQLEDDHSGLTTNEGFYKENNPLKIINEEGFGHGSTNTSYYFKDKKLFFVFQKSVDEASVNGPFTYKELRYYINDGKLIRVLKKEKTIKGDARVNMGKVKNIDITKTVKNKSVEVEKFNTQYSKILKQLAKKEIVFTDGRWIDTTDANSGIEIKNEKWIMFYKGTETNSNSIYDYKVTKKHLTLTNKNDELTYTILNYDEEILSLSFLPRGNTLTYKKEKTDLYSFTKFPSEIDGCACYFSNNKNEFKSHKYIYVDNYENLAFVKLNGEMIKFKLDESSEDPSTKEEIKIWTFNNYKLEIITKQISQLDETWQKKGTILLKLNDVKILEKGIYGECGC